MLADTSTAFCNIPYVPRYQCLCFSIFMMNFLSQEVFDIVLKALFHGGVSQSNQVIPEFHGQDHKFPQQCHVCVIEKRKMNY